MTQRVSYGPRPRKYEQNLTKPKMAHKAHDTRPTDPAIWEEIERRWRAGQSITQISQEMGRTRGQVGGLIARKLGKDSRGVQVTKTNVLASKLAERKPLPPPPPPAPRPTLVGEERFLIDLGRGRHCHFPTDKGRGADTAYCGKRVGLDRGEYCDEHAALMHRSNGTVPGHNHKQAVRNRPSDEKELYARGLVRSKMADAFFRGVI